ncbi:MAG: T9SS type A sorting domain-containing protein [Bacteroidia bacterium]
MNMRGFFSGGLIALLCFGLLPLPVQSQTSSARLSMGDLGSFPGLIVDTSHYSFQLPVVNTDPQHALTVPVSLYISIDGGPQMPLLTNYPLSSPLMPGDTAYIPFDDYMFDATRFTGGGITHDIIVWPMAMGVISTDSADKTIIFQHTWANLSHHLGMADPMPLPGIIIEGTAYTFSLTVINRDSVNSLIHPVTLMVSVDGDIPTAFSPAFTPTTPVGPGDSLDIPISDYIFDASRFGGGGITHDIIVWPMAYGVDQMDAALVTVSFVWELSVGTSANSENTGADNDYGFVAEPNPKGVTTSWETGYEKPGTTFEIEKADINGAFIPLEIIPGKGNYEMGSFYQFTDENPDAGANHYQLVAYSPTGGKFILGTATAWWGSKPAHIHLHSIRNPFEEIFTASVSLDQQGPVKMQIYDQTGRCVWKGDWEGMPGENMLNADFRGKPSGVYVYKLEFAGEGLHGKILKH